MMNSEFEYMPHNGMQIYWKWTKQLNKPIEEKESIKEVYLLYYQGEVWDIFSTFEKANEAARNLIIETYDDYDDTEILDILKVFDESRNHPCGCYDSFGEIMAKLDDIIISKYPVDPE